MAVRLDRRKFLAGTAGAALAVGLPFPAVAQPKPVRIGLLTVKTGPLAQGGIQMEQGTIRFFKDRSYTLAGRKVELVVPDTGGNPAGTKTKTQELVERDNVDMIFGPLAAFELLAITDYTAQAKMPVLSLAAAEDMTQRRPNPYFVRASGTSAQYMHPLADYAAKELKFKRVILGDIRRLPAGRRLDGGLRRLAVRRQRARHARSAPPHERARLPRVDDPLSRVPVLGLLERRGRTALPLLQPVREPAGGGADRLGRGAPDGDRRRHRDPARADRRRGAGGRREERGERLHRALELRPGRDLRRDRGLHARGAGAGYGSALAPRASRAAAAPYRGGVTGRRGARGAARRLSRSSLGKSRLNERRTALASSL